MQKSLPAFACVAFSPILLVAQTAQPAGPQPPAEKPRIFVTDSQSWEVSGSAGGGAAAFASHSQGGARPQTAEIIKTFGERCPDVIVNNRQDLADYIVVLDHEGGKGLLAHKDKVAVFEHASGDVVMSHSTLSVGGSVKDACTGIAQHWAVHSGQLLAWKGKAATPAAVPANPVPAVSPAPPPAPLQAAVSVDSTPSGADIEIDDAFVGNTPSTINLTPGSHRVAVKKKGFSDWSKTLNVSGGTIHLNAELEAAAPASAPPATQTQP